MRAETRRPPTPPRPAPLQPGEGRRPGWDLLVADPEGTVLAGWDDAGNFWAWAPTEAIVRILVSALTDLLQNQEPARG